MPSSVLRPLLAALPLALLFACNGSSDVTSEDGGTFAPVEGDFQAFRTWQSFTFEGAAIPDSPHATAGLRTEYINRRPSPGAREYPAGTLIVKETSAGPLTGRQVFAMAKVGGDYNEQGAAGWQWFELQNAADGSERILWDGVAPPAGETYAASAISCNQCHAQAKSNDFVQSAALQLAAIEASDGASVGGFSMDAGDDGASAP